MMQSSNELRAALADDAAPASNVIRLADYAHRMRKSTEYRDEPATVIVLPMLRPSRALMVRG